MKGTKMPIVSNVVSHRCSGQNASIFSHQGEQTKPLKCVGDMKIVSLGF